DTYAIATKIINIIRQIDILHAGEHLHITVSMGITTIHENDTPESVVERADQLMYIVKRSGKNSFIIE
ncbi:MAG: GGDEF domain-containing protein, partial [Sharpea porci]